MKKIIGALITIMIYGNLNNLLSQNNTQTKSVITQTLSVKGNCNQCKERIESAVDVKGVKYAEWNKKTKILTITYKPSVVTLDELKNNILKAGHDVDALKADEDAYNKLPECCKYKDVAPH